MQKTLIFKLQVFVSNFQKVKITNKIFKLDICYIMNKRQTYCCFEYDTLPRQFL